MSAGKSLSPFFDEGLFINHKEGVAVGVVPLLLLWGILFISPCLPILETVTLVCSNVHIF